MAKVVFLHPPLSSCNPRSEENCVQDPLKLCLEIWGQDDVTFPVRGRPSWASHVREARSPGPFQYLPSLPIPAPFPLGRGQGSRHPREGGPLISHQGSHAGFINRRQRGWLGPLAVNGPCPGHAAVPGRSWFRCFHTLQSSHLFKGWSPLLAGPCAQLPVKHIRLAAMELIQQL